MSKRFYCVQFSHPKQGWIDLPSLASIKENQAINNMNDFSQEHPRTPLRVIRKPHGWIPSNSSEDPSL